MKVKVLRQQYPGATPYWEVFDYDGPQDISVAGMLDYLNYNDDIVNDKGEETTRIGWECSCLQGICGACAMVINNVPALACETFLRNLKGKVVEIRPLRKFPVIKDLVIDRSSIQENLKKTNVYIENFKPSEDEDHAHQYAAAKCLKCGLCLEVCPNYVNGTPSMALHLRMTATWWRQEILKNQARSGNSTENTLRRLVQSLYLVWMYVL